MIELERLKRINTKCAKKPKDLQIEIIMKFKKEVQREFELSGGTLIKKNQFDYADWNRCRALLCCRSSRDRLLDFKLAKEKIVFEDKEPKTASTPKKDSGRWRLEDQGRWKWYNEQVRMDYCILKNMRLKILQNHPTKLELHSKTKLEDKFSELRHVAPYPGEDKTMASNFSSHILNPIKNSLFERIVTKNYQPDIKLQVFQEKIKVEGKALAIGIQSQCIKIWRNFHQPALHLFNDWIEKDEAIPSKKFKIDPKVFPFCPDEEMSLGSFLRFLSTQIRNKAYNSYNDRMARRCRIHLEELLYWGTNFLSHHKYDFSFTLDIALNGIASARVTFSDVECEALQNNVTEPADTKVCIDENKITRDRKSKRRRMTSIPIDEERAAAVVCFLIDNLKTQRSIEVLLILWIELACAFAQKKSSLDDILKINLTNLPKVKSEPPYTLALASYNIPIPETLFQLLSLQGDRRKPTKPLFSIDRSTFENYLRKANSSLGFDIEADPISPETFSSRPRSSSQRVKYC